METNLRMVQAISRGVSNWRYRLWRIAHPNTPFSDHYVARAVYEESRKGSHFALIADRAVAIGQSPFTEKSQALSRRVVEHLRASGLTESGICVDYGCGSLRIGAPLISWLHSDRYVGLDVTDRFYSAGRNAIEPDLLRRKAPRFAIISDPILQETCARAPALVFSFAVVQHVPPAELGSFFRNIAALMGTETVALIYFKEAGRTVQAKPDSWRYAAADLIRASLSCAPGLTAEVIRNPACGGGLRIGHGYSALRIARSTRETPSLAEPAAG